ncbi:MAG: hypothetical protein VKP70_05320 [Cyanobacteriota bacterium]|nr:hypothetical protein [Cyanobacteriota bacterium]
MLLRLLRMAERDGSRCAALVLLVGAVFGVGLMRLLQGGFNLSAVQSLRVLVVAMLYLVGPLVVSLIAFTRLTPQWLRRARGGGSRAGWLTLGPALLVGPLLLIHGLMGAVVGGVLASSRGGVELGLAQAMGAIAPLDLLSALARTALYLAAAALLCLWESRRLPPDRAGAEDQIASLIAREIALLVGLKLVWTLAVNPIALPTLPV